MILAKSSFTRDLFDDIPNYNRVASEVLQHRYEELYEPEAAGEISLQEDLGKILKLLQSENPAHTHLRYVWMALILALAVKPTIDYYLPNCSILEKIIDRMGLWLSETIKQQVFGFEYKSIKSIETQEIAIEPNEIFETLSETKKIGSFQILYEALDVYQNAIKALDYDESLEALLEILDDCLEGYAIFPGSWGKRELFNWWLLDVVPASWHLLSPNSIYEKAIFDFYENKMELNIKPFTEFKIYSSSLSNLLQRDPQWTHRQSNSLQESSRVLFHNTGGEKYERISRY